MKLIITQGLPGSGKSYWAENYKKSHSNTVVLTLSDIRKEINGKPNYNSKIEDTAIAIQHERACYALLENKNVIIADTNLKNDKIEFWKLVSKKFNAEFELVVFNTPIEICIERDSKRDKIDMIGEKNIRRMYEKWVNAKPAKNN